MSQDKELEIQLQFLEEATEYLNTLEAVLLEFNTNSRIDPQKINAALRAAHSIKGGAGMMGFHALSQLSHRLEDAFKVLKTQKVSVDAEIEGLMLGAVDCLRRTVGALASSEVVDDQWLEQNAFPVFEQLRLRLGEPTPEDATTMLSPEDGQDIAPLLFKTEVEGCLQRLEAILADPEQPCLLEEVSIMAAELGGLGEMLQLEAFTSLCESVIGYVEAAEGDQIVAIANAACSAWRRSQGLVLVGQIESLPTTLDAAELAASGIAANEVRKEDKEDSDSSSTTPYLDWDEELLAEGFDLSDLEVEPLGTVVSESEAVPTTVTMPIKNIVVAKASTVDSVEVPTDTNGAHAAKESQENTVRVPTKQLDQVNDLFGELTIQRNGLNLQIGRLRNLIRTLSHRVSLLEQFNLHLRTAYDKVATQAVVPAVEMREWRDGNGDAGPREHENSSALSVSPSLTLTQSSSSTPRFDVLEMDRYNELHQLSQEVMETVVQVQEVTSDIELSFEDTEQITREFNKTARQLQTNLTQVRMRPLSDLTERFPRAIRDLSLQYGKPVELKIHGGGTLIERNILEALSDPMMHLLRNAFDHGIEEPATRKARGKAAQGTIEIRAAYRNNRTLITIGDDGGGILLEKIRSRALAMGLDATLLASATEEELLSLIFEPGFSTKDEVTALSGRGVGMDVVRNNLKQIRGEIKVDTKVGIGTTFTLSVPFTLSVARVLLVESNGMLLAFPTNVIEEMILLESDRVLSMAGSEVINIGGEMLPLVRLGRWLEFNCPRKAAPLLDTPPTINASTVLKISNNSQLVALQVDCCWGEQEVAIRRVEGAIALPPGFSNCTILGDGRVVPLVNAGELLHWIASCERSPKPNSPPADVLTTPFLAAPPRPALHPSLPTPRDTILIVDDSINVRRFLALTLEKAGYQVEQAKDGLDGLEKLQAGLPAAAVICDIEMPRLDGYGFLARVKSQSNFKHIPVAMLTSRSGDKHRQLAMQLGATAYFSKPYNEQELLRTLEQLIHLQPTA